MHRNCDVDATDDNHTTPLHVAAQHNHTSAMRILLENGADMQLRDDNGDQPIHVAAEKGHHGYALSPNVYISLCLSPSLVALFNAPI